MALSERKDVVLEIKDDIPNTIVRNHEWPNALPVEINRIVISYLFNSLCILEEVDALNEELPLIMQPFVKAADRIKPLLGQSIFKKIHAVRDTKYDLQPTLKAINHPNIVFDSCIAKIDRLPVDMQIDFLVSIYNGNWNREEKNNIISLAKKEIKSIYKDVPAFYFPDFKEHIFNIIMMKINFYISNAYQSSAIGLLKNNGNASIELNINDIEQLLHHEKTISKNKYRWSSWKILITQVIVTELAFLMFVFTLDFDNKYVKFGSAFFVALNWILLSLNLVSKGAASLSERHVNFLTNARSRITQVQRENTINGQQADAEQESEPEDRKEQGPKIKRS